MQDIRPIIETVYRTDSRRVFATLVRLLGDFDLAEDALHEAFTAAVEKWPEQGVPDNPRAWLVSAGRFKAIDAIRKKERLNELATELAEEAGPAEYEMEDLDEAKFGDDDLRLIFTCCHPALALNTQVAMTLREVCGLTTEEVASAFLTSPPTVAQRIVRGKAKIRDAKIPYEIPSNADLPDRLDSVLSVIYLVFNEGYSASSGDSLTRADLSGEAIRLARLLLELLPDPEVMGLLALMLLHDSRREARVDSKGDLVLLEDQDRSLWDREQIREGMELVERAMTADTVGIYTMQAAISATHAAAASTETTDWGRIVALYDLLLTASLSPVIELNRAVAVAMRDGPEIGLDRVDEILGRGDLTGYHLAHAARADLCRRLGRADEAISAYEKAIALTKQGPEHRFLQKRLEELS
ncbi:MAG: RNA polymerase sigma factor [Candidatus Omnitrophica bacterium]|nr:RNA polymerase sigma factor [Candidatus Omnitrophota bacterium]